MANFDFKLLVKYFPNSVPCPACVSIDRYTSGIRNGNFLLKALFESPSTRLISKCFNKAEYISQFRETFSLRDSGFEIIQG